VTTLDPQIDHNLTAAEQAGLERDGFVIRRDVFTDAEVADMVEHCEALIDRLVRGRQGNRGRTSARSPGEPSVVDSALFPLIMIRNPIEWMARPA
jgi:hypothetical protein